MAFEPLEEQFGEDRLTHGFMKTIYLASGNAHKLHELQTALEDAGLPISVKGPEEIGGMPEVEESESTFEEFTIEGGKGFVKQGLRTVGFSLMTVGSRLTPWDGRPGVIFGAVCGGWDCDDEANNDKVLEE